MQRFFVLHTPLGFRILLLLEDSKIDLDTVDDTTVSDTLPRSQSEPQLCLSLTKYKKDCTNPENYKKVFFLEIAQKHANYIQIFTDVSEFNGNVAAAAVLSAVPNSPFTGRLRDHCAVLHRRAVNSLTYALRQAYQSQKQKQHTSLARSSFAENILASKWNATKAKMA